MYEHACCAQTLGLLRAHFRDLEVVFVHEHHVCACTNFWSVRARTLNGLVYEYLHEH